jgi:hypothetical protein
LFFSFFLGHLSASFEIPCLGLYSSGIFIIIEVKYPGFTARNLLIHNGCTVRHQWMVRNKSLFSGGEGLAYKISRERLSATRFMSSFFHSLSSRACRIAASRRATAGELASIPPFYTGIMAWSFSIPGAGFYHPGKASSITLLKA